MRGIGYEQMIGTRTEEALFCKICGMEFEEPKASKKAKAHCKKRCRSHWLVFSEDGYKTLASMIRSLATSEEYEYFFNRTRAGIDLLYSIQNVMTEKEAMEAM